MTFTKKSLMLVVLCALTLSAGIDAKSHNYKKVKPSKAWIGLFVSCKAIQFAIAAGNYVDGVVVPNQLLQIKSLATCIANISLMNVFWSLQNQELKSKISKGTDIVCLVIIPILEELRYELLNPDQNHHIASTLGLKKHSLPYIWPLFSNICITKNIYEMYSHTFEADDSDTEEINDHDIRL